MARSAIRIASVLWPGVLLVASSAPAPAQTMCFSASRRAIDLFTEMNLCVANALKLYCRARRMLVYN